MAIVDVTVQFNIPLLSTSERIEIELLTNFSSSAFVFILILKLKGPVTVMTSPIDKQQLDT